jgi:CheY-like chemotaxis protein
VSHACLIIVEDDPDIRGDLAEILKDEGYGVATASNGHEALEVLRDAQRPCLILLDLMMPVMSGWDFRAEQLRDPRLAAIPVVLLSGVNDLPHHAALLNAAGYIRKPIALKSVLGIAEKYCC